MGAADCDVVNLAFVESLCGCRIFRVEEDLLLVGYCLYQIIHSFFVQQIDSLEVAIMIIARLGLLEASKEADWRVVDRTHSINQLLITDSEAVYLNLSNLL